MRHIVCLQILAFLTLWQLNQIKGQEQCGEKKRIKIVKRNLEIIKQQLDTLKDNLFYAGCDKKISNRNVEVDLKTTTSQLPTSAPTTSTTTTLRTTTRSSDDICPFTAVEGVTKNITCFLSEVDIEKGLNLEKLISLKLCTDIIMMVKHTYQKISEITTFQYLNHTRDSANVEKWRSLNLRMYAHIGSWDDEKRMSANQLSRNLSFPGARSKMVTTLGNYLQNNNFDGLLISWYYPACPRDDCKIGPTSDEHRLRDFLKEFKDFSKEKNINAKIAIEVSIKPNNVIMGIGDISKLNKLVDLIMLESSSPENRVFYSDKDVYTQLNSWHSQFGILGGIKNNFADLFYKSPNVNRGKMLMELETTTVYSTVIDKGLWRLRNITAKNLCKLVLSAPETISNSTLQPPLRLFVNETSTYPINDYDYMRVRVETYVNQTRLGGVWIRDLWADDMDNECNCGAFPILRAANEALGRSTCKLPNCPTGPLKKLG